MKDQIVSIEVAKLLKELGFDWKTLHYYYKGKLEEPWLENGSSTDCGFRVDLEDLFEQHNQPHCEAYSAPTKSLTQKWILENYGLFIYIDTIITNEYWYSIKNIKNLTPYRVIKSQLDDLVSDDDFETYEGALEAGLLSSLNYIKQNKNK